jgi:hypothetical protein
MKLMDSLEELQMQDQALTERLNGLSDKLARNNLDSVSKSALGKQHEEAWQERQKIRRNIKELEDSRG